MKLWILLGLFMALFSCATGGGSGNQLSAPSGTIEKPENPILNKVVQMVDKVSLAEDEIVIFYYRADGKYEPKALWLWAFGDGDGAKNWDYTQNFQVIDGVGYMKFGKDGAGLGEPPINALGEMGFIVRNDAGWAGQSNDFVWNVNTKGNRILFIDGAPEPVVAAPYLPAVINASSVKINQIKVVLSGRHALEIVASDNGFFVEDLEGGNKIPVVDVVNVEYPNNRGNNYAKEILITLGGELTLSRALYVGHPQYLAKEKIDTSGLTVLLADKTVPPAELALGPTYNQQNKSVTFRVWSPLATKVQARLWEKSIASIGTTAPANHVVDLVKNLNDGVWTGVFGAKDPDGFFYDYLVTSSKGERAALDPYARSMDVYRNEGGAGRGAITNPANPRGLPQGGWQGAVDHTLNQRVDAIIYEIHVRDFTISPDSGVTPALKGTYLGFIEKLPYLKDLGITHVQLLPVNNFYYTDESNRKYEDSGTTSNNNYNWGYDPHSYFSPEGWFSTDPTDPYVRNRELKTLIREIHKAGMGVIMDVVYNHMANTNLLEDLVPGYYFRRNTNGTFTNSSGVGNDFNSTAGMARRLVQDSIYHWVTEYNVDGFRFDLMGLIDTDTILGAYDRVRALPGKDDILFQGEGWKMYNGPEGTSGMDQNFMTSTNSVAVFNDEIRNLLKAGGFNEEGKGYLTRKPGSLKEIYLNLIGQPQKNYKADDPGDSMNYVAAHDNLDLHDTLAHNGKIDHTTPEGKLEIQARMKLANLMLLTGQTIVFLHGGQEKGRSKPNFANNKSEALGLFVKNSYDSADNINNLVWTLEPVWQELQAYTRGLIQLRKNFSIFRLGSAAAIEESARFVPQEGSWKLSYALEDDEAVWYVLTNLDDAPGEFLLDRDVTAAEIFVDRKQAGMTAIPKPVGVTLRGKTVILEGLTGAVIRDPRK